MVSISHPTSCIMTTIRIFAVGSENPVKINCVAEAIKEFREFWPGAKADGVHTESGVSNQPSSDHEMLIGALNRARQACATPAILMKAAQAPLNQPRSKRI